MAGLDIPVEPRKRFTWIYSRELLDQDLPLTLPFRRAFQTGWTLTILQDVPLIGSCVAYDDHDMDYDRWQKAGRDLANHFNSRRSGSSMNGPGITPSTRLTRMPCWACITKSQTSFSRMVFPVTAFQQSPAMGRGIAELITYGAYRSLISLQL